MPALVPMLAAAAFRHWLDRWAPLADWLVAIGTGTLAIATFKLATRAREEAQGLTREIDVANRQVEASNRQADIANAALRASIRPWLTRSAPNRPPGLEQRQSGENIVARVAVRNIGNGLALLQGGRLRAHAGTSDLVEFPNTAFFTAPALPPDEESEVFFVVSPNSLPQHQQLLREEFTAETAGIFGDFYIDVLYTDADGKQPTWAKIHVAARERGADWVVHRIEYQRDEEESPFASVEFR